MRRVRVTMQVLTLALGTAAAVVSLAAQAPAPSGRTVWDGVYTDAQAERAQAAFGQSCASCHTLGTDGEKPLSGAAFWEGFTQKTVSDLLTYVRTNMPNGSGGSLPAATYNDLVALILKANGLPAGQAELATDTVAGVQIIPKDGPGELPANTLVRVVGCLARQGNDFVLTSATAPQRVEKTDASPDDGTKPLGSRTIALKFLLTNLSGSVGARMSVSGLLMGPGGAEGINVATVTRVAPACP